MSEVTTQNIAPKKVFIRTFGCAHNQADSEAMAGLLAEAGYELVDKEEDAELVIFNSCTVKDPSQKRFFHELGQAAKRKKVVVAGCVPQADPKNPALKNISAIGTKQIHKVVEVVKRAEQGEVVHELKKTPKNPPLLMPIRRKNPLVEIIPVNSGCLGKCTFCKTKHARGHLSSYAHEEILEKVKRALSQGVIELWFTSEDLGAYGRDLGTNIVELMNKVLELPGEFRVRLGMANPPLMLDIIDGLIEVLQHPKCYKFIHIPLQSGSNNVLEAMKREYTKKEFLSLVKKLKNAIPNITIATDVIVGFPGETEKDFEETMNVLQETQCSVVNISKFYARPGTPAAKMQPVNTSVVKDRSKQLTQWFEEQDPYKDLVGQTKLVLFTERSNKGIIGRTPEYIQVRAQRDLAKLGEVVKVKVSQSSRYCVLGEAPE